MARPQDWKPGQSGNPSGRSAHPVLAEAKEKCRSYAPALVDRMFELTRDKDSAVALRACEALWDRGFGRPAAAPVDADEPESALSVLDLTAYTGEEIAQLRVLLAKGRPAGSVVTMPVDLSRGH